MNNDLHLIWENRHYKFFCTEFNARIDQFVNASQVTNIAALRYNPFKKTIVELFCCKFFDLMIMKRNTF